ncbi:MAG: SLC13 family permease [Phycisphaerales bacterium]|nr:SLC13 family permease [Phycisphaerales bacterium]
MTPDAWITVGVLVLVVGGLATNRISIDVVMAGGLTLLMLCGVIDITTAAAGFASPAVLMLGGLFVIAAGLEHTGAIRMGAAKLLGTPGSTRAAQFRLMAPVAVFSGVMNNTPIVAIGIPIVRDWARKLQISPSALFMPLSFAAILGAKLTVIGSASNLIVMEEYVTWSTANDMSMPDALWRFFGVAAIGLPIVVIGILFISCTSKWLIPVRKPVEDRDGDGRQYRTQLVIAADSPIIGKTIEEAELRSLPGLYLSDIERDGNVWTAVSPDEVLKGGDVLSFVGALDSVMDVRSLRGLDVLDEQTDKLDLTTTQRRMVEAVVSANSPLIGRTIRDARFRTRYQAVVIAVHRQGHQMAGKIGNIVMREGDTLLLETHQNFTHAWRSSDEFLLVSELDGQRPIRHNRAKAALALLCVMVVLLATGWVDRVAAVWACAIAMVAMRCVSGTEARRAINWQVLVVIAASLGIAGAVQSTGLAEMVVSYIAPASTTPVPLMLFVLFLLCACIGQIVTPYAAAVLMFPFTMHLADTLGGDPLAFMFTMMIAVGCPFMNPVGYQTNLMVFGPGGYRFCDYARLGLPLTLLLGATAALLAPVVYS